MDTIKHSFPKLFAWWQAHNRGLLVVLVVALAARFLAIHYSVPAMLMALLLGMALNFLSSTPATQEGIAYAAKPMLRIGVALLGFRVTAELVSNIEWTDLLLVVTALFATLGFGIWLSKRLKLDLEFALLTSGAVAICGASAAVAISSVLPQRDDIDRRTSFTVIGVTLLSTIAMIFYPMLGNLFGFDEREIAVFLGATIHDVAQVVGAGFSVSDETGQLATVIKLLRVAMLGPIVILIPLYLKRVSSNGDYTQGSQKNALLPTFVMFFAGASILTILGWVPTFVTQAMQFLSSWLLLAAIAAVGMKTSLQDVLKLGRQSVMMIVGTTLFLAAYVALLIWL